MNALPVCMAEKREKSKEIKIKMYVNEPLQLRIIPLNAVTHKPVHFYEHEYRHCQPINVRRMEIPIKNKSIQ